MPQSKKYALNSLQPGELRDDEDDGGDEDRGREERDPDGPRLSRDADRRSHRGSVSGGRRSASCYFRSGAPAFASQVCWSFAIVPFDVSASIALFDATDERVALLEHEPEALLRARRGQLADDDAVVELRRRDVERRRQVDDDPVDLAVLQRLDRLVVVVEDERVAELGLITFLIVV